MGGKKRNYSTGAAGTSPFKALEALKTDLPTGEGPAPADEPTGAPRFAPKVVIRRERSGRGGRTVTVVDGVLLAGAERETFLKTLRKGLGTSARSEGDRLVFGGDIGDRLAEQLEKAGAKRIVRGS